MSFDSPWKSHVFPTLIYVIVVWSLNGGSPSIRPFTQRLHKSKLFCSFLISSSFPVFRNCSSDHDFLCTFFLLRAGELTLPCTAPCHLSLNQALHFLLHYCNCVVAVPLFSSLTIFWLILHTADKDQGRWKNSFGFFPKSPMR